MGSFSLLLNNFPIDSYQIFLASWLDGAAAELLNTIYMISLGSLALVLTITISISYGQLAETASSVLVPWIPMSQRTCVIITYRRIPNKFPLIPSKSSRNR